MAVLMWLKIMLPFAVPFWADPLLANMDHALFRAEPWQLARGIGDYALIDRIYVTWGPVMLLTVSVLLLLPESSRKTQSLLSYFLTFAAGAIGEYVLSSAGPVFYQSIGLGDRFANLHVEPWVRTAADYLWAQYQHAGGEIGGGISAMPSLHVAIAAWIALVMRAYVPKVQLIGWIWFAAIFFGSVYLGWHYAMDGIVGILITAIAWWCAGIRMPQASGVPDQAAVAELEPLRR
jgi:membrane-associated phospholipid phosphatase